MNRRRFLYFLTLAPVVVPVAASASASPTTIIYTPLVGNRIPIYDGERFKLLSNSND